MESKTKKMEQLIFGKVTLIVYYCDYKTGKTLQSPKIEINWPAIGSVSPSEAEVFANDILEAVAVSNEIMKGNKI